jgi:hypothetical protein
LKHIFGVVFLLCALAVAGADPLGLTVGVETGLGNLAADSYNFAGKAEPVSGGAAGQGSIMPFISYNKRIGDFSVLGSLFWLLNFDNPQTTQFKFIASGSYNLFLNNKTSLFTFSVDDIFKLNTYDGKTDVYQGPEQGPNLRTWNNTVSPALTFTQFFGFGSVYGKFSLPLYFAPTETAPAPAYEKQPFVFGDVQVGANTAFGFGAWLRPVLQFSPDPAKTPMAPYDDYAADGIFQQLDLGFSYSNGPFFGVIVFSFPISGDTVYANGIKDVGMEISPIFNYKIGAQGRMLAYIMADIGNIGKDTGNPKADHFTFIPKAGFSRSF